MGSRGISQKIKGKVQILKGNIQQASGHEFKGAITKIKGRTNDTIANMKLRSRKRVSHI